MKTYYLIDTPAREIRVLKREQLTLPDLHELIGCDCITSVMIPGGGDHCLYCDDEALLREEVPLPFILEGYPYPIHGRAVVFRRGADGIEEGVLLDLFDLASRVFFIDPVTEPGDDPPW